MPIKFKAKSKEEIPAELQSLYVEREGAFVLDVEGAVDRGLVEEVRNTNVALARERDEMKRRFERSESEQVKAIAAERDGLNARLMAIQIDQGVTTVASKKGLRPSAIPDITARARMKEFQFTHSLGNRLTSMSVPFSRLAEMSRAWMKRSWTWWLC